MAKAYVKVFFDWKNQMSALSDAEKGRLYDAILDYAENGSVPQLSGRESILFPVFQAQIDRDTKAYQAKVDAGRKGGLAKSSKSYQSLAQSSKSYQEEEKEEEKENEQDKDLKDIGAEQAHAPSFLLADGTEYKLTEEQITMLVNEFPMLDCFSVLADIRRWCAANPKRRKTKAGAARFISAWFTRERDKRQQWREQAAARTEKPKKEKSHKYDEIYDRY